MTEDGGQLDTDEVLAAYRRRKEAKARGDEDAGGDEPASSPKAPSDAPGKTQPPAPDQDATAVPPATAPHESGTPEAPAPAAKSSASDAPRAPGPAPQPAAKPGRDASSSPESEGVHADVLEGRKERDVVLRPMPTSLGAYAPGLRLSDRLMADATITVRGHALGRRIAGASVAFWLTLLAFERRDAYLDGHAGHAVLGMPAHVLFVVLTVLSVAGGIALWYWPPEKTVSVKLERTQEAEWARVQKEAKVLRLETLLGSGVGALGLLLVILAYSAMEGLALRVFAVTGLLLALAGLGAAGAAAARRTILHRLYVQTMILQRLESAGMGPSLEEDDRVAPVMKALDGLLGALPESSVRAFLATDEAKLYLELLDEANKGKHG